MNIIGVDFGTRNDISIYVKSIIINGKIHVLETGNIEDLRSKLKEPLPESNFHIEPETSTYCNFGGIIEGVND